MMFSEKWKKKVINVFPETGEGWVENIESQLASIIDKHRLTNVRKCEVDTVNIVLFATHPTYGDIVVKVGAPHPDIQYEMDVLKEHNGQYMCRIHEAFRDEYYFLMEKVNPGKMLYDNQNPEEVFAIGLDVILRSRSRAKGGHYPTYRSWMDNNRHYLTRIGRYQGFCEEVSLYIEECLDIIEEAKFNNYLLHGDLHHQNILLGKNGYTIIDPKGVIGPDFLEAARFMDNHVERMKGHRIDNYEKMVASFSLAYKVDAIWMWRGLYVLLGLSNLWNMESANGVISDVQRQDLLMVRQKIEKLAD